MYRLILIALFGSLGLMYLRMQDTGGVAVPFGPLQVHIDSLEIWDEEGMPRRLASDSVALEVALGSSPEGQAIHVALHEPGQVRLFQRYETSITVMDEGPHCDLTEWTHYLSPWQQLPANGTTFQAIQYADADRNRFVPVDMAAVRARVGEHCGDSWAELMAGVTHLNEYPLGVGISRIFLRVEFTPERGAPPRTFILVFEMPMGC